MVETSVGSNLDWKFSIQPLNSSHIDIYILRLTLTYHKTILNYVSNQHMKQESNNVRVVKKSIVHESEKHHKDHSFMCWVDTTLLSSQEVPWKNCFGIWRNITHKVFLNEFYSDNKYIMFLLSAILSLSLTLCRFYSCICYEPNIPHELSISLTMYL